MAVILSVPFLDINERLSNGEDTLHEAICIVSNKLDMIYGSIDFKNGILILCNEMFYDGYTFDLFEKSSFYNYQYPGRYFTIDGIHSINNHHYKVSFLFSEGILHIISLCCTDENISFENEIRRKSIHDSILLEYGLTDDEQFEWGSVKSVYDSKANVCSINIMYNIENNNKVELLKKNIKSSFFQAHLGFRKYKYLDLVLNQAIFESMKYIYDNEMEEKQVSMEKAFFGDVELKDSAYDKQKLKRKLNEINRFRNVEWQNLNKYGVDIKELKSMKNSPDESKDNFDVNNRYKISDQNRIEINAYTKLKICSKITKKQIVDVKKVSHYEFEDLYNEYDKHFIGYIDSVLSLDSPADKYLSVIFDLFNFEDKYTLEWLYSFADLIVNNNLDNEIQERGVWLYSSHIRVNPELVSMNRAVFIKEEFMPLMLLGTEWEFANWVFLYSKILEEVVGIKRMIINSGLLDNISKDEWVEFIRKNYDLLNWFERNKKWEPKKIRVVRNAINKWNIENNLSEKEY